MRTHHQQQQPPQGGGNSHMYVCMIGHILKTLDTIHHKINTHLHTYI